MAVDVYSENLLDIISPRISFSHDLEEEETTKNNPIPCRLDHTLVDSTAFEFAFNVDTSIAFQSSTADELFSDGKILATGIKKEEEEEIERAEERETELMPCLDPQPHPPAAKEEKKKSLKEFLEDSIDEEEEPNTTARSFWQFRRSNSLNCDRIRNQQRKKLIGSWKILSRSGSTGKFLEKIMEEEDEDIDEKPATKSFWRFRRSNSINSNFANAGADSNGKDPIGSSKDKILGRSHSTNDHYGKYLDNSNSKPFIRRSSSLNCDARLRGANQGLTGSFSVNPIKRSNSTGSAPKKQQQFVAIDAKSSQKRQVKNNCKGNGFGSYSNNGRVSPVLNLPSPYISSVSVDLFSFGSLFCSGNIKDRKKKKGWL